jgi:hypothetical protein
LETLELGNHTELEQQMDSNSVMLLREMHGTEDENLQTRLFEQAADQEATLISEVLDGAVITDFRFTAQDGKLYLLQPNGVTDWQRMHEHGVSRAEAKAAEDAGFRAYTGIARAELEESRLQEEMVKAGRPAAMVKFSLCGDDVMSADQLKKIGRSPETQRAFLRVSVFDGRDMHIHSRSIDGVSLSDGRGIADGWGVFEQPLDLRPDASSVDILNSHLFFEQDRMDVPQMHQLADSLVRSFDTMKSRRTGKAYRAGRAPEGVDTYKFVLGNKDLLAAHMDSLVSLAGRSELPIGHVAATINDLRYDIMSSYKQRLDGTWEDLGSLAESVAAAGAAEREVGTEFGGCDSVISARTATNAGYVNAEKSSEMKTKCVQCPSCKNIVDLPDKLLKKDIMHCVKCKASVHTKGGKVDQKVIDEYYGIKKEGIQDGETFAEYWARLGREIEHKRLQKEEELAEYV